MTDYPTFHALLVEYNKWTSTHSFEAFAIGMLIGFGIVTVVLAITRTFRG